jgi:putative membrane protein
MQLYIEIIVRYIHFISIFTIIGTLAAEWALLKKEMLPQEIARIGKIDALYGLSAITLLGAGLTLWFWIGKPADFYSQNWIFWIKIGLFSTIGILSIYPTVFFIKNGKKTLPNNPIPIPPLVRQLVLIELLLLLLIPICASLMAKGVGYTP